MYIIKNRIFTGTVTIIKKCSNENDLFFLILSFKIIGLRVDEK